MSLAFMASCNTTWHIPASLRCVSAPQIHLTALLPVLWSRLWITPLWDCSAPGLAASLLPPFTGLETWNLKDKMRPTREKRQIHWQTLPSCCRLKAWLPTAARSRAWAPTLRSDNQQSAAHGHVSTWELKQWIKSNIREELLSKPVTSHFNLLPPTRYSPRRTSVFRLCD